MTKIFNINPMFVIRSFLLIFVMAALELFLEDCSPEAFGIAKDMEAATKAPTVLLVPGATVATLVIFNALPL